MAIPIPKKMAIKAIFVFISSSISIIIIILSENNWALVWLCYIFIPTCLVTVCLFLFIFSLYKFKFFFFFWIYIGLNFLNIIIEIRSVMKSKLSKPYFVSCDLWVCLVYAWNKSIIPIEYKVLDHLSLGCNYLIFLIKYQSQS